MTISEKARQIAENYAECEWDACNEAALEMAEWLIKNLYKQLEGKKQLMHVYGGTFSCVSMDDVRRVFHIDTATPDISTFDQALKTVADAIFPQNK